jgi:hypothetical protein
MLLLMAVVTCIMTAAQLYILLQSDKKKIFKTAAYAM